MILGSTTVAAAIFVPTVQQQELLPRRGCRALRRRGGGVAAVISGYKKREEAKIHTESLKEISARSRSRRLRSSSMSRDGRSASTGTAGEQYAEWRRLLDELDKEETG